MDISRVILESTCENTGECRFNHLLEYNFMDLKVWLVRPLFIFY